MATKKTTSKKKSVPKKWVATKCVMIDASYRNIENLEGDNIHDSELVFQNPSDAIEFAMEHELMDEISYCYIVTRK